MNANQHCAQTPAASSQIFITTLDGDSMTAISVCLTVDTVHHICNRVSEATQIPVQRQKILFAGRELQRDGRTLSEHGVVAESTLHLVNGEIGK